VSRENNRLEQVDEHVGGNLLASVIGILEFQTKISFAVHLFAFEVAHVQFNETLVNQISTDLFFLIN
jgi:hypothetical protein